MNFRGEVEFFALHPSRIFTAKLRGRCRRATRGFQRGGYPDAVRLRREHEVTKGEVTLASVSRPICLEVPAQFRILDLGRKGVGGDLRFNRGEQGRAQVGVVVIDVKRLAALDV
jgi:hypothetical protein